MRRSFTRIGRNAPGMVRMTVLASGVEGQQQPLSPARRRGIWWNAGLTAAKLMKRMKARAKSRRRDRF